MSSVNCAKCLIFSVHGSATRSSTRSANFDDIYFGSQLSVLESTAMFNGLSVNKDFVVSSRFSIQDVISLASSLSITFLEYLKFANE